MKNDKEGAMEMEQVSRVVAQPVIAGKASKKFNLVTKFLLAATVINFVLILVIGIAMTAFQTRTATKAEFNEVSREIAMAGEKGDAGERGMQGLPGLAGLPGPDGSQGPKGDRGNAGDRGPTGDHGNIGAKGEPGGTGSSGPAGINGSRGTKGEKGAHGSEAAVVGGVTYTRWGESDCPSGAVLLYAGRTGVSSYSHQGGASNYVCMPNTPEYTLSFQSSTQGYSYMYAAVYGSALVSRSNGRAVACASCYAPTRNALVMIPAKTTCPSGWTREYYGYLMSAHISHRRTTYDCVDVNMEGGSSLSYVGYFYHVEAYCNGLSCPPYDNYRELNCVVCTK